jgi:hypothetical protein
MKKIYFLFLAVLALMFTACGPDGEVVEDMPYSIEITEVENGTATAAIDGVNVTEAKKDATVTLTATAGDGYVFSKWLTETRGVEFADAEKATTTFAMPAADVTVKPEFREVREYTITVTNDGNGTASATVDGKAAGQAKETAEVTIAAKPAEGYVFDRWTTENGDVVFADAQAATTTFVMPSADVEIEATFKAAQTYIITLTNDGKGTAVATLRGVEVDEAIEGANIVITATPSTNEYSFLKWTVLVGGVELTNVNVSPTTFKMPAGEVEIKAEFKENVVSPVAVTYSEGGTAKATIGGLTIAEAAEGATVMLSATLDAGYKLKEWTSDNPAVSFANNKSLSTTFVMPPSAVSIRAEFEPATAGDDVLESIPDARLRAYLLQLWDPNKDGKITLDEASRVTRIDIAGTSTSKCESLDGIWHFENLKALDCTGNALTAIDVSRNPALTDLMCATNQLTSLNVTANTALEDLYCGNNLLTSLDVSHNPALTRLGCNNNQLTTIDLSHNPALTYLRTNTNPMTGLLDLSHNTELEDMDCSNNNLTSLDLSGLTKLWYVVCVNNKLTEITLSNMSMLQIFSCANNQLTSLDISECPKLHDVNCVQNRMTALDARNMGQSTYSPYWKIMCGQQTSDGTTSQQLTLSIREEWKEEWNRRWATNALNSGVVLAD